MEKNVSPDVEYIDITPTWEAVFMPLVEIAMNARDPRDRAFALGELRKMARLADSLKHKVN